MLKTNCNNITTRLWHAQLDRGVRGRRLRQVHSSRSERVRNTCLVSQHVEETILFGHRGGAVTVVLELVDHVIHNLCTRNVREHGTPCVFKDLSSSPRERVFKDLNLSKNESKELARSKCDPQDTCRTPSAPPKKPDRQEATHECSEHGTRHMLKIPSEHVVLLDNTTSAHKTLQLPTSRLMKDGDELS